MVVLVIGARADGGIGDYDLVGATSGIAASVANVTGAYMWTKMGKLISHSCSLDPF